ncbi:hypothetical protein [Oxynema aestuarii]|uniref:Uncharacterized protein n=1 Tax=Oxynema aestuarii AP17 TaxID=2064643 RepID=A0A6H1U4N3_9CYAN|nr:hypothetical protein [Oxynema aestuarii]QIZ73386.1 hypothetical protein HCG48_24590 [Oxynema aestuarii AP17]RMH74367.1 MAG: hypothetical protein D6680_14925 [Cyanobacteria bacterium J007]
MSLPQLEDTAIARFVCGGIRRVIVPGSSDRGDRRSYRFYFTSKKFKNGAKVHPIYSPIEQGSQTV